MLDNCPNLITFNYPHPRGQIKECAKTPETKVTGSRTVRQQFLRSGRIFLDIFTPVGRREQAVRM